MIHDLKPYPAMKDSGVPWLGQVPEHWDVTRSKRLFSSSKALALPDDVQLSATQAYGVIPQDEYERRSGARVVKISMHLDKRKHVEKDDFIISMRSFQGGLERAWASGAIRSSYVVLKPEPGVNVGCFSYLLKSHDYIRALQTTGGFIRDGQDLTESDFRKVDLPLIPLAEQAAIVRFLDHADRRIRRTIAAKQRLIKLLQEQKQVIIHQAVTRGLDPDVKLKPSGVEWLGDVPEGWEITKLGRIIQLTTGFPFKSEGFSQSEEDIRLLRGINVNPGSMRWGEVVRWPASERYRYSAFELTQDDLVMGMDRPIVRSGVRIAAITSSDLPSLLVQRVARLRTSPTLVWKFAIYVLQGKGFSDYLTPIFTGISVPHLSPEQIKSFILAVPAVSEQQRILSFIDQETDIASQAISRAHTEISLLREYRTRLIADVVTGKLDVRGAVAGLPELDVEPLSADLELEDGDLEGEDAEAEADAGEMVGA